MSCKQVFEDGTVVLPWPLLYNVDRLFDAAVLLEVMHQDDRIANQRHT